MSEIAKVFTGAQIHDGKRLHPGKVLAQMQDGSRRILTAEEVPQGIVAEPMTGGVLCPGFVDLQVCKNLGDEAVPQLSVFGARPIQMSGGDMLRGQPAHMIVV